MFWAPQQGVSASVAEHVGLLLSPRMVFFVFFVQCVDKGVVHSLEVAPPPPDDGVVGQEGE